MTDPTTSVQSVPVAKLFDFAGLPGWRFLGGLVPDDSALARNPREVTSAVVATLRAIGLPLNTPVAIGPTSSPPSEKE
jgi:hypothetical protein